LDRSDADDDEDEVEMMNSNRMKRDELMVWEADIP
jgi:hypothetical protein